MASLLPSLSEYSRYKDRYYEESQEQYVTDMAASTTLYIGNLSFFSTEEQIYELFSTCGPVKRIVMGLDRNKRTPCGFCFVEFEHRRDGMDALRFLRTHKLDDRQLKIDLDHGFRDGRQFGRGKSGGQVFDDHRLGFDADRGGYGARMRGTAYEEHHTVPRGLADDQAYQQLHSADSASAAASQFTAGNRKRSLDDDHDDDHTMTEAKVRRRGREDDD